MGATRKVGVLMCLTQCTSTAVPRFLAALLAMGVSDIAIAQNPQTGDVQRVPVITVYLRVGSTEKASKRATYTPPPGWYIRSHTVTLTQNSGNTSYAVSTVPAGWAWASQERLDDSYHQLIDLAAKAHDLGLQAKLELDRDTLVRERRNTNSSHHALVSEVMASGEGLFRRAACIELIVTAELVYVGPEQQRATLAAPDFSRSREDR
jgi:hypothetical protein